MKKDRVMVLDCLYAAWVDPQFVEGYERLSGRRVPLTFDESTEDDFRHFLAFVYDVVWSRLPHDLRGDAGDITLDIIQKILTAAASPDRSPP